MDQNEKERQEEWSRQALAQAEMVFRQENQSKSMEDIRPEWDGMPLTQSADMTDEEKMRYHRDRMAELEQERVLDPVTLDRGDPDRNIRDTDQNGQYDYMEDDRYDTDKTR
jgi:hypothetical protein